MSDNVSDNISSNNGVSAALFASLPSHGLYLIHTVLQTTNMYAINKIYTDLQNRYKIDLTDAAKVEQLDESQYKKIKQYEQENVEFLISSIINEYPESAQYLRNMATGQDTVQDPLGRFQKWFGALVTIIAFIYLFLITLYPIPPQNVRYADTILGVVIGQILGIVLSYMFRSKYDFNLNYGRPKRNRPPSDKK